MTHAVPVTGTPARTPVPRSLREERLARARAALARAEARTGLRSAAERATQRALAAGTVPVATARYGSALAADLAPASLTGTAPWEGLADALAGGQAGVQVISGSAALLLAAAAVRQAQGWCAVVGGADLGWCAGAELGLALERTLVVPLSALPDPRVTALLPTVLGILLGAVEVVVLTREASSCLSASMRRSVVARARERGTLVLLEQPWAHVPVLEVGHVPAQPPAGTVVRLPTGTTPDAATPVGVPAGACAHAPAGARAGRAVRGTSGPVSQGADQTGSEAEHPGSPLGPAEMPAGYLERLEWQVHVPGRGQGSLLAQDASGLRIEHQPRAARLRVLPPPDAREGNADRTVAEATARTAGERG